MIIIYDRRETNFNHNGLAVLNDCIECVITEKLNDEYSLKLVIPLHLYKSEYIEEFNIIKADEQLFRIYNIDMDSKLNTITAYARHIFYDLANYIITSKTLTNLTCKNAMSAVLISAGIEEKYITSSDIGTTASTSISYLNGVETIFKILNIWGGELIRDNFNIKINTKKGENRGVQIKYRKNIIGINHKIDCDNVITKIYPIGQDGLTLPEKYVLSPLWNFLTYPGFPLSKKVEFPEVNNEEDLKNIATAYMGSNIAANANYKIDFMKLAQTADYKNYKVLESIEIGDTVKVVHEMLRLNKKVKVIGIEKDILTDKNTKVELGQPLNNYALFLQSLLNLKILKKDFDLYKTF